MIQYFMCRFEKPTSEGIQCLVAWIEGRGAKVGNRVELIGEEGLWNVVSVSQVGIDKQEYTKRMASSRTKLASIQGGKS